MYSLWRLVTLYCTIIAIANSPSFIYSQLFLCRNIWWWLLKHYGMIISLLALFSNGISLRLTNRVCYACRLFDIEPADRTSQFFPNCCQFVLFVFFHSLFLWLFLDRTHARRRCMFTRIGVTCNPVQFVYGTLLGWCFWCFHPSSLLCAGLLCPIESHHRCPVYTVWYVSCYFLYLILRCVVAF